MIRRLKCWLGVHDWDIEPAVGKVGLIPVLNCRCYHCGIKMWDTLHLDPFHPYIDGDCVVKR